MKKYNKMKEDNLNKESKEVLKDFSKKQIATNIFYHKIFIGMCVFVNIGFLFFIILYNNKLKEIESITKVYTREKTKKGSFLSDQSSSIDHKLVNIIAVNRRRNLRISYSFSKKEEFEMVQNFIIEYYRENPHQYDENIFDNYYLDLIFQSVSFSKNFETFTDILNYHRNALFIIETTKNRKFGIYVDELILFHKEREYVSSENKLFLFSFQSKSMHKYIGKGPALKINKEKWIEIGDEEIVIFDDFMKDGGHINYPLKSFEGLNEYDNIFTQNDGKFDIKNIEIFSFYLDMDKLEQKRLKEII